MNKYLFNALLICHGYFFKIPRLQCPNQGSHDGIPFIITEKRVYDCHQGTDRHAAEKQRRKNAKVTNTWCFLLRF